MVHTCPRNRPALVFLRSLTSWSASIRALPLWGLSTTERSIVVLEDRWLRCSQFSGTASQEYMLSQRSEKGVARTPTRTAAKERTRI
ncbi:hypothetical protein EDB83DRAFT_2332414 [Lactarius deliciosus]|nr:hypothetical protein EDB83DRAFT_2332414 [Lactarius deliciosus]